MFEHVASPAHIPEFLSPHKTKQATYPLYCILWFRGLFAIVPLRICMQHWLMSAHGATSAIQGLIKTWNLHQTCASVAIPAIPHIIATPTKTPTAVWWREFITSCSPHQFKGIFQGNLGEQCHCSRFYPLWWCTQKPHRSINGSWYNWRPQLSCTFWQFHNHCFGVMEAASEILTSSRWKSNP